MSPPSKPPPRPMLPTVPETPDARKHTPQQHLPWTLVLAALVGCYVGPLENDAPSTPSAPGDGAAVSPVASDGGATSGVPCEVAEVLTRNRCLECHGSALAAPMPLLSRADLLAVAKSDASKKVINVVVERMQSMTQPMPPAPSAPAPAADISILERWVAAGHPEGTCGASPSSVAAPQEAPKCTSGTYWNAGEEEAPEMNPGKRCLSCHQAENARRGRERAPGGIGGTVYPSLHEPDLCFGAAGNATVVITDAKNQQYQLPVNATGNFFLYGTVSFPIRAKIISGGKERVMNTPQMSGDCNSCHTPSGNQGAPGRIMLP